MSKSLSLSSQTGERPFRQRRIEASLREKYLSVMKGLGRFFAAKSCGHGWLYPSLVSDLSNQPYFFSKRRNRVGERE